jgi:hypothetical protein
MNVSFTDWLRSDRIPLQQAFVLRSKKMKRIILPVLLILSFVLLSPPVMAAELSGTVFSKGSPVANLTIAVKGTEVKTKTGPKGEYKLDLPPGEHTLIIRGQEFPVKVGSDKTSLDIQL